MTNKPFVAAGLFVNAPSSLVGFAGYSADLGWLNAYLIRVVDEMLEPTKISLWVRPASIEAKT